MRHGELFFKSLLNLFLLLYCFFGILSCGGDGSGNNDQPVTGTSITQTWDNASITWNLDGNYTIGQYCTGDWYVVAPSGVTVTSTSHTDTQNFTRAGESSSKNPPFGLQGYSNIVSGYNPSLHTTLPVALVAGDSLVTTTIRSNLGGGGTYSCNYSAAILTIVSAVPAVNSFRPPYCRPTRPTANDPLAFSMSDIPAGKWALLPRKPRAGLDVTIPDLNATIRVQGPWLDHRSGSETGEIHPFNQMSVYGAYVSNDMSEAASQLCLNYNDAELQELAKYIIQIGIDNYGIVLAGGNWPANGGHGSGRKFPIVFASVMLDDAGMKAFSRNLSGWRFGEDG